MKWHWGRLVGIGVVLTLVAAVLGGIYGYKLALLFACSVWVVLLGYAFLGYLQIKVNWVIEEALWPRGYFLKDDRQQSISVDDSILKTKFKITRKQMKKLAPKFTIKDWANKVHIILFVGLLVFGVGAWLIYKYFGMPVPGYILIFQTILGIVVVGVWMRHFKLFGLKMHCLQALFNHRCGACLYDLQGQISEPDDCVVCPECGGAWRFDRCPKCATKLDSVDTDSCPECGWNRPDASHAESELEH